MVTKQVGKGTGIRIQIQLSQSPETEFFILGVVIFTFALFINLDDMPHLKRKKKSSSRRLQ